MQNTEIAVNAENCKNIIKFQGILPECKTLENHEPNRFNDHVSQFR